MMTAPLCSVRASTFLHPMRLMITLNVVESRGSGVTVVCCHCCPALYQRCKLGMHIYLGQTHTCMQAITHGEESLSRWVDHSVLLLSAPADISIVS